MWSSELTNILRGACGVQPEHRVLLGFSGGPDSLALLHALNTLGQPLIAAHLDHALRPESADEANLAEQAAASVGVFFIRARVEVGAYATEHNLSIEEAARKLRYRYLFRAAAEHGATVVAVAHNADDQVETVLMHLLRGAGAAGLRGMAPRLLPNPWSSQIPLVRPLLSVWRREILEYCAAQGLQPVHDPTNQDVTYFRNQLRHELVPRLENLAPGFKRRLTQTADLVSADHELLTSLAEEAWRRCLTRHGAGFLELRRSAFLAEPLSLQRAMVRRALTELRREEHDLDFGGVQRTLELIITGGQTGPVDWLMGLFLMIESDSIWIFEKGAVLPSAWPQAPEKAARVEVPAELALGSGWRLHVRQVPKPSTLDEPPPDSFQAQLDLDSVGEELVLRRPRVGDRFQPLGMERSSLKLSDFFINEKLPRRARAAWPLLCRGEQIVWVPGYRLAHPYRLRAESKRILELSLERAGTA